MSESNNNRDKRKNSVICIFLFCLTLSQNKILASGDNRGIFLHKVPSYEAVQKETGTCLIETVRVLNRPECALRCSHHLPECAAILYSDVIGLCKLLRCRPTDKLQNQNLTGIPSGWDIWEDTQACIKGWILFAGHCYRFYSKEKTWDDAVYCTCTRLIATIEQCVVKSRSKYYILEKAKCSNLGAYLIELYSQQEVTWVMDSFLLPETTDGSQCSRTWVCSLWIGASKKSFQSKSSGSSFIYNSGKTLIYPYWGMLQPDNTSGDEFCVALMRTGKGQDISCSYNFQYICKMKK